MFNGLLCGTAGVVWSEVGAIPRNAYMRQGHSIPGRQVRPTRPDQRHVTRPSMSTPPSKSMRAMA
jgi:hypothetical protein